MPRQSYIRVLYVSFKSFLNSHDDVFCDYRFAFQRLVKRSNSTLGKNFGDGIGVWLTVAN